MEDLRAKLRAYEDQNRGQSSNNEASHSSKNVIPAQRETGQNPNELTEMRTYLAEVMAVVKGFDNRLSIQQNTPPTPSDRS